MTFPFGRTWGLFLPEYKIEEINMNSTLFPRRKSTAGRGRKLKLPERISFYPLGVPLLMFGTSPSVNSAS